MGNQTFLYFSAFIQNAKELNKKEKEILLRRLQRKKLAKIGKHFKVSAERVRQIEERALHKINEKVIQLLLID
ncbi:MAG: hypothetical protein HY430_00565 [Candidatus Levybacteria bacterium]|nr:hypothetical protein [Candidatus Levybacteria bacterium]